jgi:hypothetical protein
MVEAHIKSSRRHNSRLSTPETTRSSWSYSSSSSHVSPHVSTRDAKAPERRILDSPTSVHNRLYDRSKAMQAEGKEKREQIARSLARKSMRPAKKISAEEASSLFDRLYDEGVLKQISLGRKKNKNQEMETLAPKVSSHLVITPTEAEELYSRLYGDAMTKKMRELKPNEVEVRKAKIISQKQANSLYERLYGESTISTQRARHADE